jgi:hypothetical protein
VTAEARPAFYALAEGGWRDYITLLHVPYSAWHLSYVAIGAALTPEFALDRLLPTLAAFFLAVGIGAHALDELNGRPLRTRIPGHVLVGLAVVSLGGAIAIGIVGALTVDPWIGAFVAAGAFIVVVYNDAWFALAWGAFPVLTGFFACAGTLDGAAALGAVAAFALSLAQRRLSTRVRDLRRRVARVSGTLERLDGSREELTPAYLISAEEAALRALTAAVVALAAALVIMRVA